MKFHRCVSKVLAVVGLALGALATPQLTGGGAGQYQQPKPNLAVVLAALPADQSDTIYDVRLRVLGEGLGRVRGEMRQRPQVEPGGEVIDLIYRLEGQHVTLDDGRVLVQAAILLDLAQFGGEGLVQVGEMEGLMFPIPGALGYCPVLPPTDKTEVLRRDRSGKLVAAAGAPVLVEPSIAPDPFPGEFIARWILY